MKSFRKFKIAILTYLVLFITSCVPYKELQYFSDINKIDNKSIENERKLKLISPFDNLYIKVLSTDEKTSKIFNTADDFRGTYGMNGLMGYMVDERGNINFPFVGDISVAGKNTTEASEKIHEALSEYISNTSVIVKYIDNKVSLMGEVAHPGIFQFNEDKITIYQAISLAGGLTRFGSHKNIILIRQEGKNVVHRIIDINSSKIASSENYYILPNDVLIVEPLRSISWSYENLTYTTVLTSITTLVTLFLALRTLK